MAAKPAIPIGCLCQRYGKTGVPNPRGFCLVCGEAVRVSTRRKRTAGGRTMKGVR